MKKTILKSGILCIAIFIVGCSAPYQAKIVSAKQYYQKVTKKKQNNKRPQLGIALSGGGSKSAPFAMGVLKQFIKRGWLDDVDIISSVSGGSYSAYYLYSKEIYMNQHPNKKMKLEDFFKNCELDEFYDETSFKDYNKTKKEKCKKYGVYQSHVKRYQDLLSFVQSETARSASHWDDIKATGTVVGGSLASIITAPFHDISNTLFDWKIELSPTQYLYKEGIIRAYGKIPENKNTYKNETFEDLQSTLDNNKSLPLWIINTSNFKKNWWKDAFTSDNPDLNYTIFEITPYGFGSMEHNYTFDSPSKLGLDLPRATLASAAFFDALGDDWYQGLVFGGMHLLNMRWGVKIPSYTQNTKDQLTHNLLPWPLYYLDMDNSKITLADGGQSENLGIYSLIKRKVKNIVIVSGSQDNTSDKLKFDDLCNVATYLEKNNMSIWFEGKPDKEDKKLIDFNDEFCQEDKNSYHKISYYEWRQPIWKGYIKSKSKDKNIISTLYYIKAAIDIEDLNKSALKVANNKSNKRDKDGIPYNEFIKNKCYHYHYHYPYSLSYFWQENGYGKCASGFPQTSTKTNTLNSSQNLYQAYMDLGYYLSGFLNKDTNFKNIISSKK